MEILEAIKQRHSVRQYSEAEIEKYVIEELQKEIDACNEESGLHIQLVLNEPKAFGGFMAHYGKFSGVKNYIALVGKKCDDLDEKCGYYGERVVLKAQRLGLNSCWVAMTYKKIPTAFKIDKGEKLTVVIALGYGKTQGSAHAIKTPEQVSNVDANSPDWFISGVEAALLAPTAMNQQKFTFNYSQEKVVATTGFGFYTKIDLGIAKYHFEVASNHKCE